VGSLRTGCVAAAVSLAIFTALAACDSATAGQPQPKATSSQSSKEPTDESTSESETPKYSLVHLCELISSEEAQELGGSTEGKQTNSAADGHAVCQWADKTSLTIGFQTGVTTANAESGPGITLTPTTIEGLKALQQLKTDPIAICQVMVELPSGKLFSSSAAVRSAGEGQYDPCQVANQLANLIIPRVKDQ
jgi:uncharacterized protein DUF3558